jgi:hypothetical protein
VTAGDQLLHLPAALVYLVTTSLETT